MLHILTYMGHINKNGSRKKLSCFKSHKFFHILSRPVLGNLISLSLLPALFSNCSDRPEMTMVRSLRMAYDPYCIETLDIFTFNDDTLRRLDSYQRIENDNSETLEIRSQNGSKHIVICANSHTEKDAWTGINSLDALRSRYTDLRMERREALFMSGEVHAEAGTEEINDIRLRPLVSEVVLRSIRNDFSGKEYEGEDIRDAKVYLTNVNARCVILSDGETRPTHIINAGGLDDEETSGMADPEMLVRDIEVPIGPQTINTDISLLCYPSSSPEEGPGTPFTRLVIEGSIEGDTYWWPIPVNRGEGCPEPGIHRNRSYIYDVVITGKGSSSPDEDIMLEKMNYGLETREWEEKDEYMVCF